MTTLGVFMILGWLVGRDLGRLAYLIHDTRRLRRENERLEREFIAKWEREWLTK